MSEPSDSLFKTEAEIAALIGLRLKEWHAVALTLERSGLPAPDPLFGGRRYWPAVRAFLDRRSGLEAHLPYRHPDGEENLDAFKQGRARPAKANQAGH